MIIYDFMARIDICDSYVEQITVWIHELLLELYAVEQWVRDHLNLLSITDWQDYIKDITKQTVDMNNLQIVCAGNISGSYDYFGEFDDDLTINELKFMVYDEQSANCVA